MGLVSNASAQLFPDNTLSSLTNFLREQLNLKGQGEVAKLKLFYQSMYQNATEGKIIFLIKFSQKRLIFPIWNPVFTLPLRILL